MPAAVCRRHCAIVIALSEVGLSADELVLSMKRMVGFRNIAVHEYQELDLAKVRSITEPRLDDLATFAKALTAADPSG
jgi:uncharacterized protein YutE (UPF0331/DUF86 family)